MHLYANAKYNSSHLDTVFVIYVVDSLANVYYVLVICVFCVSSVVRAFVHGAMGRRIDPSW